MHHTLTSSHPLGRRPIQVMPMEASQEKRVRKTALEGPSIAQNHPQSFMAGCVSVNVGVAACDDNPEKRRGETRAPVFFFAAGC